MNMPVADFQQQARQHKCEQAQRTEELIKMFLVVAAIAFVAGVVTACAAMEVLR